MRFSRTFAFLAGAATVLAGTAVAQVGGTWLFSDIEPGAYYEAAVNRFAKTQVARGYDDGRFGPDDPLTRAQFFVLLDRYDKNYIDPLRGQIRRLGDEVELGWCGDGFTEYEEQCDDGNLVSGDGCTAECVSEISGTCEDGHRYGETFPSEDGCNSCTCTFGGVVACTKMACVPTEQTCMKSRDCPQGMACAEGMCVSMQSLCGNGSCEAHETPYYTESIYLYRCPQDCLYGGRFVCGNGVCERGETGDETSLTQTYCPKDCGQVLSLCEQKKKEFEEANAIYLDCYTDRDCVVFQQSCPYVTCGTAVNVQGQARLKREAEDIVSICRREGEPETCASCIEVKAACQQGKCVLKQ